MDKTEREAIRARCEAASPGAWLVGDGTKEAFYQGWYCVISPGNREIVTRAVRDYYNPNSLDEIVRNDIDFIAHARQDLPMLLDALDEVDKLWKQAVEGSIYWQKAFDDMKADRDRWKVRAEALERAIKTIDEEDEDSCSIRCCFCINYGNCTDCTNYTKWEFDEARFAEEAGNENSD
jgi:hypothetical protein